MYTVQYVVSDYMHTKGTGIRVYVVSDYMHTKGIGIRVYVVSDYMHTKGTGIRVYSIVRYARNLSSQPFSELVDHLLNTISCVHFLLLCIPSFFNLS